MFKNPSTSTVFMILQLSFFLTTFASSVARAAADPMDRLQLPEEHQDRTQTPTTPEEGRRRHALRGRLGTITNLFSLLADDAMAQEVTEGLGARLHERTNALLKEQRLIYLEIDITRAIARGEAHDLPVRQLDANVRSFIEELEELRRDPAFLVLEYTLRDQHEARELARRRRAEAKGKTPKPAEPFDSRSGMLADVIKSLTDFLDELRAADAEAARGENTCPATDAAGIRSLTLINEFVETLFLTERVNFLEAGVEFRYEIAIEPGLPANPAVLLGRNVGEAMHLILQNAASFYGELQEGAHRGETVLRVTIQRGVEGSEDELELRFEVIDGGRGIPEHLDPDDLFAGVTHRERTRGTGTGLPLVREIARAHGGDAFAGRRSDRRNGAVFGIVVRAPRVQQDACQATCAKACGAGERSVN